MNRKEINFVVNTRPLTTLHLVFSQYWSAEPLHVGYKEALFLYSIHASTDTVASIYWYFSVFRAQYLIFLCELGDVHIQI